MKPLRSSRVFKPAAAWCLVLAAMFVTKRGLERSASAQPNPVPRFEVDPFWPKMPSQWILGQVAGIATDAQDHVWLIQRPWSLNTDEKAGNPEALCCREAPPVMEFDAAGNYIQGWGGEGQGYEWPRDEHGIFVDHKNNVWLSSAGGPRLRERTENFILKFTRTGQFVFQVGRRGQSKGSLDTANFNNAADIYVHPATNEAFIADGYVNRRVVVLDADTGAFKRMWGAYGKPPDDSVPNTRQDDGPGPAQFNTVHGIKVSTDGLVYVADRINNRVQIFSIDGTFKQEVFVERKTRLLGTAFSFALSPDSAQTYLYLADAGNGKVHIFERRTMREVGAFGRIGHYAGQFVFLHNLATDSKGNLYTAEVGTGRRAQKFVLMAP
jgi:hypothetical protein